MAIFNPFPKFLSWLESIFWVTSTYKRLSNTDAWRFALFDLIWVTTREFSLILCVISSFKQEDCHAIVHANSNPHAFNTKTFKKHRPKATKKSATLIFPRFVTFQSPVPTHSHISRWLIHSQPTGVFLNRITFSILHVASLVWSLCILSRKERC